MTGSILGAGRHTELSKCEFCPPVGKDSMRLSKVSNGEEKLERRSWIWGQSLVILVIHGPGPDTETPPRSDLSVL